MPTLHTLLGVFASPARTLPAAAAERRVVVPVVAATVASLALAAALVPRIDWERAARAQLEGPEAAQMTPHEREEKVAQARKLGALSGYGGAAAGPVLRALAVALFLWMGFRVAGTRPAFGPALSVAAWGLLPASLGRLLAIPAVVRAEGLVPDALPRILPWNGAYWLPAGAPPAAAAAATSLDLFGLWSAALLVLGMAAVAGASRARAAAVVGALWLGLSAAGMAAAALAAGPAA